MRDPLPLFVRDSLRIEGIHRDPTMKEIGEHKKLLGLKALTVQDIEAFVAEIEPGAKLRRDIGMDVRIGNFFPLRGGPRVERELYSLLTDISAGEAEGPPWPLHIAYEELHPFTDGNGRSGRAIWAWQMRSEGRDPFALPVLQMLYYQALDWGLPRI